MNGVVSFIRVFPVHKPPKHEPWDKAKCFSLDRRHVFTCFPCFGLLQVVLFLMKGTEPRIRVFPVQIDSIQRLSLFFYFQKVSFSIDFQQLVHKIVLLLQILLWSNKQKYCISFIINRMGSLPYWDEIHDF
jgi:hypothetical protein